MAGPFQLSPNYLKLLRECRITRPNAIDPNNEFRRLFPDHGGGPHALTTGLLSFNDIVLTIASVWVGLRQIKYPYRISFGHTAFYQGLTRADEKMRDFMPSVSDAFICPVTVEPLSTSGKRKLRAEDGQSDSPSAKRRQTSLFDGRRTYALAVCEPASRGDTNMQIDIRSMTGEYPPDPAEIFQRAGDFLSQTDWQGKSKPIIYTGREVIPPGAPDGFDADLTILHAWTYMLDLPVREVPDISYAGFRSDLRELFVLALQGRLTYELLRMFLEETKYIYPSEEAEDYQCIPQAKYRRHLERFRSVEIRTSPAKTLSTPWAERYTVLRQDALSHYVQPAPTGRLKPNLPAGLWNVDDIEMAIGALLRATFTAEFSDLYLQPFSMHRSRTKAICGPKAAPMLMVHSVTKSKRSQYFMLSCSRIQSRGVVQVTHYGCNDHSCRSQAESNVLEIFKGCDWDKDTLNLATFRFEHRFELSPERTDPRIGEIYAVLFAWSLILGLEIATSTTRPPESERAERLFRANARDLINDVCPGRATVEQIEAFVYAHGLASPPAPQLRLDHQKKTRHYVLPIHRDRDDLDEFAKQSQPPTTPTEFDGTTTPETATTPDQLPATHPEPDSDVPSGEPRATSPSTPTQRTDEPGTGVAQPTSDDGEPKDGAREPPSKKPDPPVQPPVTRVATPKRTKETPVPLLSPGDPPDAMQYSMYDTSQCTARVWMEEYKEQLQRCRASLADLQAETPALETRPFSKHNSAARAGSDFGAVGEAIASLWLPMWYSTHRFGFADASYVNSLCHPQYSRSGMAAAAGGPNKFLMPLFSSLERRGSPEPDQGTGRIGHIWLAVAELLEPQPPTQPSPRPRSPKYDPSRRFTKAQRAAELKEGKRLADLHGYHVRLYIWDTAPALQEGDRIIRKTMDMVRYSGWATGSEINAQGELFPKHWNPNFEVTPMPCPDQDSTSLSRQNPCGLLTILNAWAFMLGLLPADKRRQGATRASDFYAHLLELIDLAVLGCLTTRTMQAFMNAFGWIEEQPDLRASVIDLTTLDPAPYGELLRELARANATPLPE